MLILEVKHLPPTKYVAVQDLPMHSMASQRMDEIFNKYLGPFVNLCHACGHKPTSVLLVPTMWYDGGENVGTTEMYEKTLELEETFQKVASSAIHLIPYSVRFDGSHDRNSACDAIDLDMMHSVCVGINPIYLYLLYLSVNLSGSFYPLKIFHISGTSFATSTYPLMAC